MSLSYDSIRNLYKTYLQSLELGKNTVGTVSGDTFYLWNHGSKELFWNTVCSDDFEASAKTALKESLVSNSTGNVEKLLNGYVSNLRRFRSFIFGNGIVESGVDDATALKEFLLDIDCLDSLSEWTSRLNIFDILRISRTEIRHSNMLSWLLDPNENHGLSDSILRGFIQYYVSSFTDDNEVFDLLLMDFHNFSIQREWHRIDVIAVSNSEECVLCIENKIDSSEHDNQLNRYRQLVEELYPDYKRMLIYLSPEGSEPSDPDNWCSMSYENVLDIVESSKNRFNLLPDVKMLIENYVATIRRDIVGDEKLARICAEIYAKHQKALDLIFENKPDRASQLAEIIRSWASQMTEKGELEIVIDKCNKTYTRFKTKTMSKLLPDAADAKSGWGTSNYYFYEVRNIEGKEFFIQLAFSSKDIPLELREMCDRINKYHPSKQQKANWQWRTPFSTQHFKTDEELSEDKIFDQLSKQFEKVKAFETKLDEELTSDQQ